MRINRVFVENFRAISFLELNNISNAAVIAGPNGCGKSSVFDAIRLVKSSYGQYQQNEYTNWYNEFQIDINKLESHSKRILNDPTKPLKIEIDFELDSSEIEYLKTNSFDLFKRLTWTELTTVAFPKGYRQIRDPKTKVSNGKIAEAKAVELSEELISNLEDDKHTATLEMMPGDSPSIKRSVVLEFKN